MKVLRVLAALAAGLVFFALLTQLAYAFYVGESPAALLAIVGNTIWSAHRAPDPPMSLQAVVEPLGRLPAYVTAFDPERPGRVYAGGWVSNDRGRHWEPLVGADGRIVTVLGARRSPPMAAGPGSRILCAGVLFEEPGAALGRGEVAAVAAWDGAEWSVAVPGDAWLRGPGMAAARTIPVIDDAAYTPEGVPVVASNGWLESPGRASIWSGSVLALLFASDGRLYAIPRARLRAGDSTGAIERSSDGGRTWETIAIEARDVVDIAEGPPGRVYIAADRLGRRYTSDWYWTAWPTEFRPEGLAAHPRGPLVAAWGEGRLVVSRDFGATLPPVLLGGLSVVSVSIDPFEAAQLLVVDREGLGYRVTF